MSDVWDFYMCVVEDQIASIFLDLGLEENAPLAGLTDLVLLRLFLRWPTEDGLSSDEEFEALSDVENAIENKLAGRANTARYVGRVTSGGTRDFYFYADTGERAEALLSAVTSGFPDYTFEIRFRRDPDWSGYFEFLYPSARELHTLQNGQVIALLQEHGDRHEIVRTVEHFAYFPSAEARDHFVKRAATRGYRELDRDEARRGRGRTRSRWDETARSTTGRCTSRRRNSSISPSRTTESTTAGGRRPVPMSTRATPNDGGTVGSAPARKAQWYRRCHEVPSGPVSRLRHASHACSAFARSMGSPNPPLSSGHVRTLSTGRRNSGVHRRVWAQPWRGSSPSNYSETATRESSLPPGENTSSSNA